MTAGVLDRPSLMPERLALDGRGTLEELLSSALGEAQANGSTECPVCHARTISTRAREASASAECSGCGSRLS